MIVGISDCVCVRGFFFGKGWLWIEFEYVIVLGVSIFFLATDEWESLSWQSEMWVVIYI